MVPKGLLDSAGREGGARLLWAFRDSYLKDVSKTMAKVGSRLSGNSSVSVVKFGGYGVVEVSFKLSIPGFDGAVLLRKDYIIPRWGGAVVVRTYCSSSRPDLCEELEWIKTSFRLFVQPH